MDDQERTLARSGLNAAMMAAFNVKEGGGRPVGIVLAIAVGFFEMLCPKAPLPAGDPTAAGSDLSNALTGLKNEVIDAIWKGKADVIGGDVLAQTKGFYDIWGDLSSLQVDTSRCILTNTNQAIKTYVAGKYEYFNVQDPIGMLATMRRYRNTLQLMSANDDSLTSVLVAEHQTRTIGLYGLIGSLTAAYLKAAIAWIWGRELLLAWQYDEYQQDLLKWNTDPVFQAANPLSTLLQKYEGVDSNPYYSPPDWNTWIDIPGSPVHLLIKEVQDMLDYCVTIPATKTEKEKPGLYTRMWTDLCDFDQKISSYDVTLPPSGKMTKTQMIQAVEQGAARSGEWETLAAQNASLANVTEDDIVLFGLTIDAWRTVSATVRFKVYVTQAGDTLQNLAQTYYGDPLRTRDLFDVNKDAFTPSNITFGKNGTVVAAGVPLKIFEEDALQYLT